MSPLERELDAANSRNPGIGEHGDADLDLDAERSPGEQDSQAGDNGGSEDRPPRRTKRSLPWFAAVIVLLIMSIGVVWAGFVQRDWGSSTTASPMALTEGAGVATRATADLSAETMERGADPATPSASPEPKESSPGQPKNGNESNSCGFSRDWDISVSGPTSCAFALSVSAELDRGTLGGEQTVRAHSPVTDKTYDMRCAPQSNGQVTCTGGNHAMVLLKPRA